MKRLTPASVRSSRGPSVEVSASCVSAVVLIQFSAPTGDAPAARPGAGVPKLPPVHTRQADTPPPSIDFSIYRPGGRPNRSRPDRALQRVAFALQTHERLRI